MKKGGVFDPKYGCRELRNTFTRGMIADAVDDDDSLTELPLRPLHVNKKPTKKVQRPLPNLQGALGILILGYAALSNSHATSCRKLQVCIETVRWTSGSTPTAITNLRASVPHSFGDYASAMVITHGSRFTRIGPRDNRATTRREPSPFPSHQSTTSGRTMNSATSGMGNAVERFARTARPPGPASDWALMSPPAYRTCRIRWAQITVNGLEPLGRGRRDICGELAA